MLRLTLTDREIQEAFVNRLNRGFDALRKLGVEVNWSAPSSGDFVVEAPVEMGSFVRQAVGEIVADTVLTDFQPKLLHKAIVSLRPQYKGARAQQMLLNGLTHLSYSGSETSCERETIADLVAEYLQEYDDLHIEGFVRFRLRDYYQDLVDCARQVIDDYEVEKERAELIGFLKEFVVGQSSDKRIVHVLPDTLRAFRIVDDQGREIECGYPGEYELHEVDQGEIDTEELLIASLITAVPGQVVFHMLWDRMDMILEVFAGRVRFCPGCERCMKHPERSTH